MDKPTHSGASITQTSIEDLSASEDQAAEVKGGAVRPANTYTGTTQINSGTLTV
jgi:hypothetical protein